MKRLWLLLIAFVLPLQTSWAAVHVCDGELGAAQHLAQAHDGAAASHGGDAAIGQALADACCGAAHSCHGLHNLMGAATLPGFVPAEAPAPAVREPALHGLLAAGRPERPQWRAA